MPLYQAYDYFAPENDHITIQVGSRVVANIGSTNRIGIIIEISQASNIPLMKIKNIDKVLDEGRAILSKEAIQTIKQFAKSNFLHIGKLAFAALPPQIRKSEKTFAFPQAVSRPKIISNFTDIPARAKQVITELISNDKFTTQIVTGNPNSGKKYVSLAAITATIAKGKTCLVVVPEISAVNILLTEINAIDSQIKCGVLHSELKAKERLSNWLNASSGNYHVLITTRVGIFTPMPDLGLICVINENDPLHRTENNPIYSARDIAGVRTLINNCPLLMTSATLSLELRQAALQKKINILMLSNKDNINMPKVNIVDISNRRLFGGISTELEVALKNQLREGGLSVVLVNRRGQGGMLYCLECRHLLRCNKCQSLISLDSNNHGNCKSCGNQQLETKVCPGCGSNNLTTMRSGSVRVAEALTNRIPEARIQRIDADSDNLDEIKQKLTNNEIDIIVGTKMLFGFNLQPATCCVTDADSILYSANLKSAEYLLDTINKLSSSNNNLNLIIQTRFPNHHIFSSIKTGSYDTFALTELKERKTAGLPPFRKLALFYATGKDPDKLNQAVGAARYHASVVFPKEIALMELVTNADKTNSRIQFLISSPNRKSLQDALNLWWKSLADNPLPKDITWGIEVDPLVW